MTVSVGGVVQGSHQTRDGVLTGAETIPNASTGDANYTVLNRSFDWVAPTSGLVELTSTHTADQRSNGEAATDDIGRRAPTVTWCRPPYR